MSYPGLSHSLQGPAQNENMSPLFKNYEDIQDGDRRALNQVQGPSK